MFCLERGPIVILSIISSKSIFLFLHNEFKSIINIFLRVLFTNLNSYLSIQSSINPVFSRHIAYQMFKPYVFSLVFALMSRNKGNFLFSADYLIQQSCGSTLRFPCSVSVNVHCGTDISVSEKLLHIFRCCTV